MQRIGRQSKASAAMRRSDSNSAGTGIKSRTSTATQRAGSRRAASLWSRPPTIRNNQYLTSGEGGGAGREVEGGGDGRAREGRESGRRWAQDGSPGGATA
eukprot:7770624-Pyramimonas_sp.AAC.1